MKHRFDYGGMLFDLCVTDGGSAACLARRVRSNHSYEGVCGRRVVCCVPGSPNKSTVQMGATRPRFSRVAEWPAQQQGRRQSHRKPSPDRSIVRWPQCAAMRPNQRYIRFAVSPLSHTRSGSADRALRGMMVTLPRLLRRWMMTSYLSTRPGDGRGRAAASAATGACASQASA